MTTVAGVPDAARADARRTRTSTTFDLESVRFLIAGGGPVTPGLARGGPRAASAPRSRPATRAPRPASGSAPRSTTPTRTRCSASAGRTPAVDLAVLDEDDRAGRRPARSGACCLRSPAVMAGYWRDPEATRGRVHRRRLRAHRRPRLGRRPGPAPPRRPEQGDVRARRLQRVPGRGRGGALRPSRRRRGRGRARGPTGDGRDRRRRRRPPRRRARRPTLDELRAFAARPARGVQAARGDRGRRRRCRSPRWRRSTAARSPTCSRNPDGSPARPTLTIHVR